MLTLILVRHAKAGPHGRGDDSDRALTDRGEADAGRLGKHLADIGQIPRFALISSAKRTAQTFELLTREMRTHIPARSEQRLYNAGPAQICQAVAGIDPSVDRFMVVGHNPGIMEAALRLATGGDSTELLRLQQRFAPGGAAIIEFEGADWPVAMEHGGTLKTFVLPEDLV